MKPRRVLSIVFFTAVLILLTVIYCNEYAYSNKDEELAEAISTIDSFALFRQPYKPVFEVKINDVKEIDDYLFGGLRVWYHGGMAEFRRGINLKYTVTIAIYNDGLFNAKPEARYYELGCLVILFISFLFARRLWKKELPSYE